MQKIAFAVAFSVFSFLATQASAVTVLNTTQDDVKKQCDGKTKCSASCGSTLCDYVCEDPSKQCTVAVFRRVEIPVDASGFHGVVAHFD
jgi:hypothetical protein